MKLGTSLDGPTLFLGNGARTTAPLRETKNKNMAATGEQAVIRVCKDIDLAKIAKEMVSWEKYAPYCGLSQAEEMEIKENSRPQYGVQKRRMLERWKERLGDDATYRNLAAIFEGGEDQKLADFVRKLAQDSETKLLS